jgi:hypothetical protein
VQGAPTYDVANAVAKSVASSSLVKTAMYGQGTAIQNWLHDTDADIQMLIGAVSSAPCELRSLEDAPKANEQWLHCPPC